MSGYVDDVGGVFPSFYRWEDSRECITADLAGEGAEEMARQFGQAEDILLGLLRSAESVNLGFYLCVSEALDRARAARKAAEPYAAGRAARGGDRPKEGSPA